jgi:hypothetical protein
VAAPSAGGDPTLDPRHPQHPIKYALPAQTTRSAPINSPALNPPTNTTIGLLRQHAENSSTIGRTKPINAIENAQLTATKSAMDGRSNRHSITRDLRGSGNSIGSPYSQWAQRHGVPTRSRPGPDQPERRTPGLEPLVNNLRERSGSPGRPGSFPLPDSAMSAMIATSDTSATRSEGAQAGWGAPTGRERTQTRQRRRAGASS